jgi:SAM-dependent methyltransferase
MLESGYDGITRRLLQRGRRVLVVGRDGRAYETDAWPESRTFRSGAQENLLIADNRTADWQRASPRLRRRLSRDAFGGRAMVGDARHRTTALPRLSGRLVALASRARTAIGFLRFELRRRRLARRYLRGEGLEIGALHAPLQVPGGVTVRYVDRMDVAELRHHYPDLAARKLVAVDVIDDGERLLSQSDASVDFVIANHFIEHTEDPLAAIASHLRVLRPGGILYLAVPDRRRTFDRDRAGTPLEHLVADHQHGPSRSRREHQEEWARLVEHVPEADVSARADALEQADYSIHFHTWAPAEFEELLGYARQQAELPFDIEAVQANEHEFIAILRRT